VIKKRKRKPGDKWHLDEMTLKPIGIKFVLWRAVKPLCHMMPYSHHRSHKGLNNRAENAHQPTRRKEKCLIKFKSPQGVQNTLSLMGKVRNIFAIEVGRYTNKASKQ
jgi:putative transposase